MKKFLSSILCLIMVFSMSTPAFAANNQSSEYGDAEIALARQFNAMEDISVELQMESGFTVHKISFPTISELIENTRTERVGNSDDLIATQNRKNIQVLKEYIEGLNLTDQDKQVHIRSIDEFVGDGYLDGYKIYTKSSRSTHTFYGTYSGTTFYERPSSEISVNYKKETERNLSNLNKWIATVKDLVLTIEDLTPISMAITVLDIGARMFSDNYSAKTGDYCEYYVRTVRRVREIGLIDAWGDFRPVLVDNKVDMYPYSVYHFADPSIYNRSAAVTEYMNDWRTLYSEYYNNKSYNMQAAYNQYTQRPDIILYMQGVLISSSMFKWELK